MEKKNYSEFIFTAQQKAGEIALNEINKNIPETQFVKWLQSGMAIIKADKSFKDISKLFKKNKIVFVRHINPINSRVELNKDDQDIEKIKDCLKELEDHLDKGKTFSIQTRIFNGKEYSYKGFDINEAISSQLADSGYKIDIKSPEQIISIIIDENNCYIGISDAEDNLSNWSGGERRFAFAKNQISRAEFKLLEVIELAEIDFSQYNNALDLGAAPGGWTKVLLDNGLKVEAVDPAELDKEIANNPNVYHFKGLAQEYLTEEKKFDVIVNDMRMDVFESIGLMEIASEYLSENGVAIMTLKLPTKKVQNITNRALERLEQSYKIYFARQLFHNRSEVTVVLKKA